RQGPVASTRIEDGLYEAACVTLCVAAGRPDPDGASVQIPIAAVQLRAGTLDLDSLTAAVKALPEYARPRELRVLDEIPLTDGVRPIKWRAFELPARATYRWNTRAQRYEPQAAPVTTATPANFGAR